jgi:hypothetical protein
MSKSNSKKEISFLRQYFHQALEQQGFIQDIAIDEDEVIEIIEKSGSGLKKVVINNLNCSVQKVDKISVIDLEKELAGISASGKTPEKAVLVLEKKIDESGTTLNYHLYVCLIELKASLQPKNTLKQICGKFQSGMNRMYGNSHNSEVQSLWF